MPLIRHSAARIHGTRTQLDGSTVIVTGGLRAGEKEGRFEQMVKLRHSGIKISIERQCLVGRGDDAGDEVMEPADRRDAETSTPGVKRSLDAPPNPRVRGLTAMLNALELNAGVMRRPA